MEVCDYCGAAFDTDEDYLNHLAESHQGELSRLDRRKVQHATADSPFGLVSAGLATGPVVIAVLILFAGGVVAYVSFGLGTSGTGSGETGPSNIGSVHYHGTITMTVLGEQVDFSRDRYQLQADAFHFEEGIGRRWHVHAQGVTLQWAMQTLGINVTRQTVSYDGRTYRDDNPEFTVIIEVNGEPVTPSEYVLQEGDRVSIIVRRA